MNTASASTRTSQPAGRYALVACAVVALHIGMLWLVQRGLLMQPAKPVVLVEVIARLIEPPAPAVATAPAPPKAPAPVEPPKILPRALRALPVQPRPQAAAQPAAPPVSPALPPEAPPAAIAPSAQTAPLAAAPSVKPAPPSPLPLQLPSSDADYLQNPPPPYPSLSKRLNEQGKTIIKVLIGADGLPQRAEIVRSSGFERLDQAALATVMRWRYVPGKRGGVAETMWFNVPINWVLE